MGGLAQVGISRDSAIHLIGASISYPDFAIKNTDWKVLLYQDAPNSIHIPHRREASSCS